MTKAGIIAAAQNPKKVGRPFPLLVAALAVALATCLVGATPGTAGAASTPGTATITAATPDRSAVTLRWAAPISNGGSPITGYVVIAYIGDIAQPARSFNSATTQTITGLTNGTAYRFKVRARNARGLGPPSSYSNGATPSSIPGGASIGATLVGDSEVTLKWYPPLSNGGSPITGYVVMPYIGDIAQPARSFNSAATTQTITRLTNGTAYRFKVRARNARGLGPQSSYSSVATPNDTVAAPEIVVYGNTPLIFGTVGLAQPDVNVIGRVSPVGRIRSLTYQLNGAAPVAMGIGPDSRRLTNPGDFNAAIPASSLVAGDNTVTLHAVTTAGHEVAREVIVRLKQASSWPLPYTVNWSTASSLDAVVQPIDGHWAVSATTVRTLDVGYDRLLAVGDRSWTNFEATVPITVHAVDPNAYTPTSGAPGIGFIAHWIGHERVDDMQPGWGFSGRFGGLAWYRFRVDDGRLEIADGTATAVAKDHSGKPVTVGVTYVYKLRAESGGPGLGPTYQLKVWRQGSEEPTDWDLSTQLPAGATAAGSLVLVAHHVDASFGTLSVRSLNTTVDAMDPVETDDVAGPIQPN